MDRERMSASQNDAVNELRQRLGDLVQPHHTDRYLSKWLIARNFDLSKAEQMFRKSQEWRQTVGADTILDEHRPSEVLLTYYPGGMCGEDHDGCPVWIDPVGQMDLKGILKSEERNNLIKYMIYKMELLQEKFASSSIKYGRPIDQCVHVLDFDGFGTNLMTMTALNFFKETLAILSDNYPESLKRTFIINAPAIFSKAYAVIKRFMAEDTAAKFVVLSGEWRDVLSESVDMTQLPEYYGGSVCDDNGDPKCSSMISYGGKVPETYFLKR